MKRRRGIAASRAAAPALPSPVDTGARNANLARPNPDMSELDDRAHSDGEDEEGCSGAATEALTLVCGSGFVKVDEFQLASLLYCNVCRESNVSWQLRINDRTPESLMRLIQAPLAGIAANRGPLERVYLPLTIQHLRYDLKGPVLDVAWPERLLRLSFGDKFDQPVEALRWAPRLECLWLGQKFNQAVEAVDWPKNLRQLRFGYSFNQPVQRARWPTGLEQLIFGYEFNRPIAQMKEWPATLILLSFGHAFNQSLEGVSLPHRLEFLEFGHEFNQSLQRVTLPEALRHLRFFHSFNHPLEGVVWPVSLRHVWLCGSFVQPVRDVDWPSGLRVLALPHRYRQAAAEGDVLLPYGCRLQLVGCG